MSSNVVGSAVVEIGGDVDEGGIRSAAGRITRLLATAGVAAGTALATGIGKATLEAADLNESINAIDVTLGEGADSFIEFGRSAASELGIAQSALNEAVVPLGSLLANAGVEGEALSGQLQDVATRATDVASVFNKDVNEVLEAFGSAARGEVEPIRALGVNFNAAEVEAKAMALGLADANGEVDEAAKTQARLAIVMEQTNQTQGDFAATAGSLPNLMRRISATVTDAGAQIGQAFLPAAETIGARLLPAIEDARDFILDLIDTFDEAANPVEQFAGGVLEGGAALGGFGAGIKAVFDSLVGQARSALPSVSDLFAGLVSRVSEAIPGIIQTVAGMIPGIVQNFIAARTTLVNGFLTAIGGIVDALPQIIPALLDGIRSLVGGVVNELVTLLPLVLDGALQLFQGLVDALGQILPVVVEALVTLVGALAETLPTLVETLIAGALTLFTALVDAIPLVVPPLIEALVGLIGQVVQSLVDALPVVLEGAVQLFTALVDALPIIIPTLLDGIVAAITAVLDLLPELIGDLLSAAVTLFTALVDALPIVLPAILEAVVALMPEVIDALIGLVPELLSAAKELFFALVDAITQTAPDLLSNLGAVIGDAVSGVSDSASNMLAAALDFFSRIGQGLSQTAIGLLNDVGALPGRILGALGDLGGTLVTAGKNLIQGLIDGIKAKAGELAAAAASAAATVRSYFPFSPAKEGPLSGSGDPLLAGREIIDRLSKGIQDASPEIALNAALTPLAASNVSGQAHPAAGASIVQNFYGPSTSSERLQELDWTLRFAAGRRGGSAAGRLS